MGMFTLRESGRARTHRTSSPASQAHPENRRGRRRHPLVFDRLEDRTVLSPTVLALTSIAVTPANPSVAMGLTQQFTAIGTYADGSTADLTNLVTWASATPSVATISSTGLAQSLATGTFTVTAGVHTIEFLGLDTAGGDNTAFLDAVSVATATPPTAPTVGDSGFESVQVGAGKFAYDPTGSAWTFAGGAGISANGSGFTAGNPAAPQGLQVAFIQGTGSITQSVGGWSAGSYTISFDAAQRGNYGTSVENFEVLVDGNVVGTFNPTGTSYQTYTTGTTNITAALGGVTSPIDTLTVTPAALTSIAVTPANPSVANGLTQQFTATGTYTDGSTAVLTNLVTWASATPSVATISSTGLAQSLATGTTNITAALGSVTSPIDILTVTALLVVTNTNDSGPGSLRRAILIADVNPSVDTIDFAIPGAGVHTISPVSALPTITDPVIIDGYTQPGASPNTLANGDNAVLLIELDGSNAGAGSPGLVISAGNSTVRGLVINRFGGDGIYAFNAGGNVIVGNFIGTDATGERAVLNSANGVLIDGSSNNTIGGTAVGARNVISGNIGAGVSIDPGATNNVVLGNFIGTDATGERAVPNSANGVLIDGSSNNTIGGTAVGARNVISGNTGAGVSIDPGATNNVVPGNFIGTDATGEQAVPNRAAGVLIGESSNNTIGGTAVGARNVISDNIGAGVSFGLGATNNVVQGNVISGNIGAGVYFGLGATNNVVQGNVTSGNIGGGVSGPGAANNVVQGNLIPGNGEPNLPPSNNTQPAIQLVPAQNSSLALIATLVVTSLNGVESQIMSVGSGTASVLPTQATAPSGKGGEGAHAADESGNPQGGLSILIPPALRPWVLVLLGTNEALDRMRGAIPDLFTSGDGQQGPVELLSRAYQAVVRTIDEAIPFLASQGDPISLTALPVPAVAWDIDEVASDLALEEPFQPQATPSAASAAADGVRHLGEVLARPTKLWRVGLVGGFITGSTVIAANAVRKAFQRHRR